MHKKPKVVLVAPQLGENIGSAARAMLNFGLDELALISPRDGWPNERADTMSSGALDKMPPVKIFENTAEAIQDCHYIYATTARPRDMVKPVFTAAEAAADMRKREAQGQKIGILFGGERTGLHNDDVARAHTVITIPANPEFTSINLGQAVLLVAYQRYQTPSPSHPADGPIHLPQGEGNGASAQSAASEMGEGLHSIPLAQQAEFDEFVTRLETELETRGFFRSLDMKPNTLRNIRSMLLRTELTSQEIKTWHGIVSALIGKKVSK